MTRCYFDIREGDEVFLDEKGLELSTLQKVQEEAALSLADMARDAVRGQFDGASSCMVVEVGGDSGPVMQVKFTFEVEKKQRRYLGTLARESR
jgi:hypothetical protein